MIKAYSEDQTDSLIDIWRRANALAHPFLPEAFVAEVARDMRALYLPNAQTWVICPARTDGAPAGFIALIGDEIGGLFLDPAHHGLGLGRALLDHAAALKGALRVNVFTRNTIGRAFYDRQGFVITGEALHAPSGERVLTMHRAHREAHPALR